MVMMMMGEAKPRSSELRDRLTSISARGETSVRMLFPMRKHKLELMHPSPLIYGERWLLQQQKGPTSTLEFLFTSNTGSVDDPSGRAARELAQDTLTEDNRRNVIFPLAHRNSFTDFFARSPRAASASAVVAVAVQVS